MAQMRRGWRGACVGGLHLTNPLVLDGQQPPPLTVLPGTRFIPCLNRKGRASFGGMMSLGEYFRQKAAKTVGKCTCLFFYYKNIKWVEHVAQIAFLRNHYKDQHMADRPPPPISRTHCKQGQSLSVPTFRHNQCYQGTLPLFVEFAEMHMSC